MGRTPWNLFAGICLLIFLHRFTCCRKSVQSMYKRGVERESSLRFTGKASGKAPQSGDATPEDKAQMSFTDPELGIIQTNNKGWDYCGNALASVDKAYQIIVACDVTAGMPTTNSKPLLSMAQLTLALAQAGFPARRRQRREWGI